MSSQHCLLSRCQVQKAGVGDGWFKVGIWRRASPSAVTWPKYFVRTLRIDIKKGRVHLLCLENLQFEGIKIFHLILIRDSTSCLLDFVCLYNLFLCLLAGISLVNLASHQMIGLLFIVTILQWRFHRCEILTAAHMIKRDWKKSDSVVSCLSWLVLCFAQQQQQQNEIRKKHMTKILAAKTLWVEPIHDVFRSPLSYWLVRYFPTWGRKYWTLIFAIQEQGGFPSEGQWNNCIDTAQKYLDK